MQSSLPDIDVCAHYSLKYQAQRDVEGTYSRFKDFINNASQEGGKEVLLLTGSGPKKAMNSLSCIQR